LRLRLSVLMFLQYAVPGAWVPLFSLRLAELSFSQLQIGWAGATYALASLTTPFLAGQLADRWFPAQRCLACFAAAGGCLLWLLAGLRDPDVVFWTCLAVWLVLVPAVTLTISICFTHLPDPARTYGSVRMWGTIGWVVPGLLLGCWFAEPEWLCGPLLCLRPDGPRTELPDALRLGGLLAFLLAAYALTLPHTPPARARSGSPASLFAPLAALRMLRRRPVAVYCICALGVCFAVSFNSLFTPLLLRHLGLPPEWLSPTLTISQTTEILTLGLLPWLLLRLGTRGTMALGLFAAALLMSLLSLGGPPGLIVPALGLNGLCICCFLIAGQVFVNSRAAGDVRVSTQSLLTFVNGVGLLLGNLLGGWISEQAGGAFAPTFGAAAAVCCAALLLFALGFSEGPEPAPAPEACPGTADSLVPAQKMT
jgi:predicted MFS family arabinose efflux permease